MSGRKIFALALLCFCLPALSPCVRAQAGERARAAAEIESLREQIKAKEAVLLAPSKEDREAYAEFLAQPHTGLVRLLPREKWINKLSTNGDGAFYSFVLLKHEYGQGSDIMLEGGQFQAGFAGADFAFLVNLGDMPLENILPETEGVRTLAAFQPPSAEPEARGQQRRAGEGFKDGERSYSNRMPAVVNNTYALRSISYDRSDVLVAFRVVRSDDDGSAVLLWKLLRTFPKPLLQRNLTAAAGQ